MLIVRGNDAPYVDAQGCVLAIGNFDGVHRGHQALIEKARATAQELGTRAGAIVFEPHPREFFAPDEPHFRLTPLDEKLRLFSHYGLDVTVVLPFSDALAKLSADAFIDEILVARLRVRHVVVGFDFLFGKGRSGTVDTLRAAGKDRGFGVSVVAAQSAVGDQDSDGAFSSSAIRQDLNRGDVQSAARALGHWWRITGKVVTGAKVGSDIGFPTANILAPTGTALAHGVYAVRVHVDGRQLDGAAYFGKRPTVDDGAPVLEVTIFGFDGDLYGKDLAVAFIDFVRPDQTFPSLNELKAQIEQDCASVRALLDEAPETPLAYKTVGSHATPGPPA